MSSIVVKIYFVCTNSLPNGISTITLPNDNVIFTNVIQNSAIQLQNRTIVVTKEIIQSRYPYLLNEIDSSSNGLMFQQKYIFYEDSVSQRTVLGSLDVFERHDKREIQKLLHNGGAFIFDTTRGDSFQFLFSRQKNNQLTIIHQTNSNTFELLDCNLSSKRPILSCDIVIYVGTFEASNGSVFAEKRLLFPVASCTNLKLNKVIHNLDR